MKEDPAHRSDVTQADSPGLYKKVGWEGHREQSSKHLSSKVSASVVASCFLICVPALISLSDGLWSRCVRYVNPFFPKLL